MRKRQRGKLVHTRRYYYDDGSVASVHNSTTHSELMLDRIDNPKGYNPVEHYTLIKEANGLLDEGPPVCQGTYSNVSFCRQYVNLFLQNELKRFILGLSFQKNDNFELLNFIAEADELFALFNPKFWKSISYGSANWALLPLVSDIQSLRESYLDLFSGRIGKSLSKFKPEVPVYRRFELKDFVYSPSVVRKLVFNGFLRFNGIYDIGINLISRDDAIHIILDELGVHPDLKTVWDLVPMSFVLDYYLPIGSALEAVSPRGWYNPDISFTGWVSFTGTVTCYPGFSPVSDKLSTFKYDVHVRRQFPKGSLTTIPSRPSISLKTPSYEQIFNTAYVARSNMRRRSARRSKLDAIGLYFLEPKLQNLYVDFHN